MNKDKSMWLSIFTHIELLDKKLLLLINHWNTPWTDELMWVITQTYTWIPFYLMACYLIWRCYGRKVWKILLLIILAVGIANLLSSDILKPLIQRLRPSHTPGLMQQLHLHKFDSGRYFGNLYGFPSSHATNSTVIAILLYIFLKPFYNNRRPLVLFLLFYVLIFCYTRPYLGLHYPSDIIAGWILGTALCLIFNTWIQKNILVNSWAMKNVCLPSRKIRFFM